LPSSQTPFTPSPPAGLRDAHDLLREKYAFYFSTLQVETKCLDEDHARDLDISTLLLPPVAART
jgi:hypothetical protein